MAQDGNYIFQLASDVVRTHVSFKNHYGITLAERHTPRLKKIWECRCGSRKCTGTMLQPKR